MLSPHGSIVAVLDRLIANAAPGVNGALVATTDGIVLASRMGNPFLVDRLGTLTATVLGATVRIARLLHLGATEAVVIITDHGQVLVMPAGTQCTLAIHLGADADRHMISIAAREAAAAIESTIAR